MSSSQKLLQDQGVLVTRPEHQAQNFIHRLQSLGANIIRFPSIEIHPVIQSESLSQAADPSNKYHIIVFISANAAENGLKWIENAKISLKNTKIAAIGKSTKAALEKHGQTVHYFPEQVFNSEALLELNAFDKNKINHQTILIIKGEGGRELIQNTLKERGARVILAEVYQRKVPQCDTRPLLEQLSKNQIQWTTVTSNEILKNLYYMLNEQGHFLLRKTRLIVPSQRCYQLAQELGFTEIFTAQSATDEAMLTAIKQGAQTNQL